MDHWSAVRDAQQTLVARARKQDVPVSAVTPSEYTAWLKRQGKFAQGWLKSIAFKPERGRIALVPNRTGTLGHVLLGLGDGTEADLPWTYAPLVARLPQGRYVLDPAAEPVRAQAAALGWLLASYRFTRYKKAPPPLPVFVWPKHIDRDECRRIAEGINFGRELINVPAEDMGPEELANAALSLAELHGAEFECTVGKALLRANYPAVYAVGRASPNEPRLIDLRWGDPAAPKVTLVGKGVCFDSGGLDLKSAAGMRLMKKDMGGAASVLGLAHMLMDSGTPVRLRVLIPAVENSIDGLAMRPGDVLNTRKGITVEVGNTDAEGRLILCDALAEADSEDPDLLIDFATLTGAARVALGTDLPALFSTSREIAAQALAAGERLSDPMWPMPLYAGYRRHLDSSVAALSNVSNVEFGGAITAALFLREFVDKDRRWMHVDTMAWNTSGRPGRPVGGELLGVRAMFAMLRERYA